MLSLGTTGGGRNAIVPALIICAFLVLVLLLLVWRDGVWSGPLVVGYLLVCFGLMTLMGRRSHGPEQAPNRTDAIGSEETFSMADPMKRRLDDESVRAMLQSRRIALDEQNRRASVHFSVGGLTCAAEAAALAHRLRDHDGVIEATVNPLTNRAYIDYEAQLVDPSTLAAFITSAGYSVE